MKLIRLVMITMCAASALAVQAGAEESPLVRAARLAREQRLRNPSVAKLTSMALHSRGTLSVFGVQWVAPDAAAGSGISNGPVVSARQEEAGQAKRTAAPAQRAVDELEAVIEDDNPADERIPFRPEDAGSGQ